MRYLYETEYPPSTLRLSLVEASQGTAGSAIDRMMVFCHTYDPETGEYTLVMMDAIRLGGAITLLVLAGTSGLMIVLERKRDHKDRAAEATDG